MKPRTLLTLLSAVIILSGCTKDSQEGNGRFRINFSTDASVVEVTRALEGLVPPTEEEFSLQIVKKDGGYDRNWASIANYPQEGYFIKTGVYTATALCGNISTEGFGSPCFGVTKEFSILDQTTVQVDMIAKLLNMAVTVEYTEAFKGYFPQRNAEILRGETRIVDFSTDPDAIAFIKPEAFKVKVSFTYQNNGTQRTGTSEFDVTSNVGACTHLKVKLDVNQGEAGGASIEVTFNDSVESISLPVIETGDEE